MSLPAEGKVSMCIAPVRHPLVLALVAAALGAAHPAGAQSTSASATAVTPEALETCAGIADPGARLACFDTLVPSRAAPGAMPAPAPAEDPADAEPRLSRLASVWAIGEKDSTFDLQPHRPTYILPASYSDDPNRFPGSPTRPPLPVPFDWEELEAKFQLSFKFKLADLQDEIGGSLWAGYTQQSYWQVYEAEDSRPFRETNYEPELMLAFHPERELLGMDWRLLNFGVVHQSNGRGQFLSRSWNRAYAQVGLERGGLDLLARAWYRFEEQGDDDDNPDIDDYLGHGDLLLSYTAGRHQFSLLGRYAFDTGHGAVEASWSFPLARRVRGYVQVFSGYGESMVDYNWKQTTVGAGIALTDWF